MPLPSDETDYLLASSVAGTRYDSWIRFFLAVRHRRNLFSSQFYTNVSMNGRTLVVKTSKSRLFTLNLTPWSVLFSWDYGLW